MKLLSIVLAIVFATTLLPGYAAGNAEVPSNVVIREIGDVRLHSFMSVSVTPMIIETDNSLIIIDFPGDNAERAVLFREYVESLNKPITRYFISHLHASHFRGIENHFPNTTFYSVDADYIMAMDEGANLTITPVADGSELTVDGIRLIFEADREIEAWIIRMPDLNAVFVDHLAYANLHVFFYPLEPRLTHLRRLEAEGYTWFMPGHGAPMEAPEFVDSAEAYFNTILEAVATFDTIEEMIPFISERHPDYVPVANIERFLPRFME